MHTQNIDFKSTNSSYTLNSALDLMLDGGLIYINSGIYELDTPITPNSNNKIILEKNAILKANKKTDTGLIIIENEKNISILGHGVLDGNKLEQHSKKIKSSLKGIGIYLLGCLFLFL